MNGKTYLKSLMYMMHKMHKNTCLLIQSNSQ